MNTRDIKFSYHNPTISSSSYQKSLFKAVIAILYVFCLISLRSVHSYLTSSAQCLSFSDFSSSLAEGLFSGLGSVICIIKSLSIAYLFLRSLGIFRSFLNFKILSLRSCYVENLQHNSKRIRPAAYTSTFSLTSAEDFESYSGL
jgi:hypothetical protein